MYESASNLNDMKNETKRYVGMPSRPRCKVCFGSGVMDFGLGEDECSSCDGIGFDNLYTGQDALDLKERLCLDEELCIDTDEP